LNHATKTDIEAMKRWDRWLHRLAIGSSCARFFAASRNADKSAW
jgi:hypothetical protein